MSKEEEEDVFKKLKDLLDEGQEFPSPYTFKFIVAHEQLAQLKAIINRGEYIEKPSRAGKYVSVSVTLEMNSSDEIIDLYRKVAIVEGIISL